MPIVRALAPAFFRMLPPSRLMACSYSQSDRRSEDLRRCLRVHPGGPGPPSRDTGSCFWSLGVAVGTDHPRVLALEVLHHVERVHLADGRPEVTSQAALDPPEKEELPVVRLEHAVAGRFR